ncbi:uracil-DNA glycosylase [Congregibacter sp.]|uniref:uracil-DNA glycosylase n=1 Tax=Congregibacter sp. TaxID=2744308 RepID=UPI003F6B0F98
MPKYPIHNAWGDLLKREFASEYMTNLSAFLKDRRASGKPVFPPAKQVFNAFESTAPQSVRVVILGQDPYHSAGQAHGLCFSVNPDCPIPPSLRNIFKELQADQGIDIPSHGCLSSWAKQGVLLLNTVLTVEEGSPGSHRGKGWERFTDRVISILAEGDSPLVFMLWGAQAQAKASAIDARKHCVLRAPHPSPLSAHRGFFGCGHFGKANDFLRGQSLLPIDWSLGD